MIEILHSQGFFRISSTASCERSLWLSLRRNHTSARKNERVAVTAFMVIFWQLGWMYRLTCAETLERRIFPHIIFYNFFYAPWIASTLLPSLLLAVDRFFARLSNGLDFWGMVSVSFPLEPFAYYRNHVTIFIFAIQMYIHQIRNCPCLNIPAR